MANHTAALVALADPTRRLVFERVAKRPASVTKLASGLDVTRSAVSQHLKVLKDAGLVIDTEEGTRRIYRIDPRGIQAMQSYLDRFWDGALAAFKEAAEEGEE